MIASDDVQLNLSSAPFTSKTKKRPIDDTSSPNKRKWSSILVNKEDDESDGVVTEKNAGRVKKKAKSHIFSSEIKQSTVVSSLFERDKPLPIVERVTVKPGKEEIFATGTFEELQLHPFMIKNLTVDFGITKMTTVQKASIPVILSGKDSLIKSQTGSGKTLAYAIPIVHSIQQIRPKVQRSEGTSALVIVPTRELAIQSSEWFDKLVKPFQWIVPGCLMGGEKKKSEKARLRKGINILVTTPGRLLDHMQHTTCLNLQRVKWLILDEADRLLDMGYEKDIATIVAELNKLQEGSRQTVMLSATLSTGVEKLAGLMLTDPQVVDVSTADEDDELGKLVTPENLQQHFVVVPAKLRLVTLAAFILWKCQVTHERKMLIFMSAQDVVDFHTTLFQKTLRKLLNSGSQEDSEGSSDESSEDESDITFFRLHGNMTQKERTDMFRRFRDAKQGVLLCTDVAARGLDLPQVHWIVQFSAPARSADYVHRVGRTARIGACGHALLFLLPSEVACVQMMEHDCLSLQEMEVEVILSTLTSTSNPQKREKKSSSLASSVEAAATALQLRFENALLSNPELLEAARKAFLSHVRAYSSYPGSSKHIFNFKALHLGHVAKSLGLRETPTHMGARGSAAGQQHQQQRRDRFVQKRERRFMSQATSNISEFSSGLQFKKKPPRRTTEDEDEQT